MNRDEAKRILALYRPGTRDQDDPEISAALAEVERDPELKTWFEQHSEFQAAMRQKLRDIPVPEDFKTSFIPKVVPGPAMWWTRQRVLAAAAAVILVATGLWLFNRPSPPVHFEHFRSRMARTVLREYSMDKKTPDMQELRQYLNTNGAPSDYDVPKGLQPLALTGGGVLTWRGNRVSMTCFDRGKGNMLFMFVIQQQALPDPPAPRAEFAQVNKLMTASWSSAGRTYLLAGRVDEGVSEQLLRQHLVQ